MATPGKPNDVQGRYLQSGKTDNISHTFSNYSLKRESVDRIDPLSFDKETKMRVLKDYYIKKNERLKSKSNSLINKRVMELHQNSQRNRFK